MKTMINLIKMHYTSVLALKKTGALMILLAVFITVTNKNGSMLPFGAALLIMFLNYNTLAYEDKSKMSYLVYSLPVKPKEYILSKYIYGAINTGITIILADFICMLLKKSDIIVNEISLSEINMSIFLIGFIAVSIAAPIALVAGFNKARLIIVFLCVFPICFSGAVIGVMPKIADILISMSMGTLECAALGMGFVLTVISYIVCSRLYCKKDIY